MPTTEEWAVIIAAISLTVWIISVVLYALTLSNTKRTRIAAEQSLELARKKAERERILADMKMYRDIAAGNFWKWNPWTVPAGVYGFDQWSLWRERCINYAPRVADVTYTEFAALLAKQKEDKGGERWDPVVKIVTIEANRRLAALQAQLARIDA